MPLPDHDPALLLSFRVVRDAVKRANVDPEVAGHRPPDSIARLIGQKLRMRGESQS